MNRTISLLLILTAVAVLATVLVRRNAAHRADIVMNMEESEMKSQTEQIQRAIRAQMETYPLSTLKDLYKSFFQDAFGPGHLMAEGEAGLARMKNYLASECEQAKDDANLCPDYELTGWHGRFYRVNLSLINDGKIPFDAFLAAFIKSAEQFMLPDLEDWKMEWNMILAEIEKVAPGLESFAEDKEAVEDLLANGEYASHHSDLYENAYKPHYRLIERSIFESEILPML